MVRLPDIIFGSDHEWLEGIAVVNCWNDKFLECSAAMCSKI